MSLLVLSSSDVEQVASNFTPTELQDLMALVFHLIASPPRSSPLLIATPHRTSIAMQNHTALFMPARVSHAALHGTTMKAVCIPRDSDNIRGLPASTIVMDETTGAVKAIVNARSLTALRNAAGSLLSTRLVGMNNPTYVVAFGAGKQIEAHLDLHLRSFPSITSCTIVNRTLNARVAALKKLLTPRFPLVSFNFIATSNNNTADPSDSPPGDLRSTLISASLIICATSATSPLFPSSWVRPGTHVILIGSYTPAMREVDHVLIRRAINPSWQTQKGRTRQVLLVDSRQACAVEAGELIDANVDGTQIVEIGELVALDPSGALSGDQEDGDGPITMFKSVGVGLQDVAMACAVVAKAEEMGVGTTVANYDA
ncbi:hypothetical protein FPV67DRAFT_1421233 [Lyophyllum atratum]|nr:hypothetical protein FPV67DRAFT_1421233 [Lyophyllum atratum]